MTKIWTGDKSYIVVEPVSEGISDEALLAFAQWCRLNHPRTVYDPVLLRRVFDAYSALPPEKERWPLTRVNEELERLLKEQEEEG